MKINKIYIIFMEEKMKKLLLLLGTFILGTNIFASEIITEYYLMERVLMDLANAPTYTSNDGDLKAIKIDKKLTKYIGVNDDVFYIIDSNNKKQLVRVGDYFVSPTTLSSIYKIDKDKFESNYNKK